MQTRGNSSSGLGQQAAASQTSRRSGLEQQAAASRALRRLNPFDGPLVTKKTLEEDLKEARTLLAATTMRQNLLDLDEAATLLRLLHGKLMALSETADRCSLIYGRQGGASGLHAMPPSVFSHNVPRICIPKPAAATAPKKHKRPACWSEEEQLRFALAVQKFGTDWHKGNVARIASEVGTRTVAEIRNKLYNKYARKRARKTEKGRGEALSSVAPSAVRMQPDQRERPKCKRVVEVPLLGTASQLDENELLSAAQAFCSRKRASATIVDDSTEGVGNMPREDNLRSVEI